jgi:hypothetical protein
MTHDPLCPFNPTATEPVGPMGPDMNVGPKCQCNLIARVRADERAAALRDAVEAVKGFVDRFSSPYTEVRYVHPAYFIEAIEALGSER